MRRFAYETLLYPEFTLRYSPRITVRGQTVQGGSVPLRKAPLPSRLYPWSTKRPCGPLAFRRATEGSRVQRKVRGVKRGQETIRFLTPNFEAFSISAILRILKLINAYKTHFVVNNSKSCYKM